MKSKLKRYITENILDGVSKIKEEEDMFDPETADQHGGRYTTNDSGLKPQYYHTQKEPDYDREPAEDRLKVDRATRDLYTKQEKLQQLLDKKDVILMQYKSGQMSLDQYKDAIGNLPQEIKNLRDQIIAATSDEDEMTADDNIG